MSDREMLEFAAKAAGIGGGWQFVRGRDTPICYRDVGGRVWNPITDDGDALRLAVRLNIPVFPYEDETSTGTIGVRAKNWGSKEANTRRAIVRAAAEIGRQMP